ncbi:MAG: class I SAM-dependent methyltransferase [Rhabdaerophilum sp.]
MQPETQQPVVLTATNVGKATQGLPRTMRAALHFATGIRRGRIDFILPTGQHFRIAGTEPGPEAELHVLNWRFARRVMFAGDVGLGETYRDGDWDSPDVTSVVALFASNAYLVENFLARSPVARFALRIRHLVVNRNTKTGSKRNISAHYDLGNRFYSSWLDRGMTYSSAIFEPGDNDLTAAQDRKYRVLADAMGVRPGDHVLEIGCGWGGFAEFLARERSARVTALTISREQYEYARQRIAQAGLSDKVEIRFQDYRDETGVYDRIGSIEMFEAVGESYWPHFFRTLKERLKPGGTAGLQIITIPDHFFEDYRRNVDFIRRHIFPGGMLPSPSRLGDLAREVGLKQEAERIFGGDYAETLRQWRDNFESSWPRLLPMGFDERFRRLWRYYLCYCEAGFDVATIDVRQIVYRRH